MDNNLKILKTIDTENNIWIIYFILIGLSFWANSYEKKYYIYNDLKSKEKYRQINTLVFSIALVVYNYFFTSNYNDYKNLKQSDSSRKKFLNEINYLASLLILVAGTIFLFISIFDTDLDTEIAFS